MKDDTEKQERRLAFREKLHRKLDQLLDSREKIEDVLADLNIPSEIEEQDRDDSDYWSIDIGSRAVWLHHRVIEFAAEVVGEAVTWYSLIPRFEESSDRSATLKYLADRLKGVRKLIGVPSGKSKAVAMDGREIKVPGRPLDVEEIWNELVFLAHGDKSPMFEREKRGRGRKGHEYRVAHREVEAFIFDAKLQGQGLKPGVRHQMIVEAFEVSSWDTIRKWKPRCMRIIGKYQFGMLVGAEKIGPHDEQDMPAIQLALEAAGKAYQAALRASAIG